MLKSQSLSFKDHVAMYPAVFSALAVSTALLILLLCFNYWFPDFMKLDAKWLGVAALPLLIGLVIGGYISKFKGLGVEVELALKAPIHKISVKLEDASSQVLSVSKESMYALGSMTDASRKSVTVLRFDTKDASFYQDQAVEAYIEGLPNLKYVEVVQDGVFFCIIPVAALLRTVPQQSVQPGGMPAPIVSSYVHIYIEAIRLGPANIKRSFGPEAISATVSPETDLYEALRQMKTQNVEALAVLSPQGHLVQIVERKAAESVILEAILAQQAATN